MTTTAKRQCDSHGLSSPGEITELLWKWGGGDRGALDELLPMVYNELQKAARDHLKRESSCHTLQTAALINEVYLQLANSKNPHFQSRELFFFFAGQIMRHVLVKYARSRLAAKRGGGEAKINYDEEIHLSDGQKLDLVDLMALDNALTRLGKIDPRQSKIIELRFFAGMSNKEVATFLEISLSTLKREWRIAKLWLSRELRTNQRA